MSSKSVPKIADVDPDWIDIGTIRKWIPVCKDGQAEECAPLISLFAVPAGPRLPIDVDQGCLVHAQPGYVYAALSYVWGQTKVLKTTQDKLVLLLEKESISAQANMLPRSIGDTMGLVRIVGLRCLWVDCLCIVQDNLDSKHTELQNMGNIYIQAFVTVIAANGWDAEHGLRGIREVKSQSRDLSSISLKHDF